MANGLMLSRSETRTADLHIHQTLHGYAEGHRLLESSFSVPDDLKRVMLRMSDSSGTGVVSGFQEYLTGYPLNSLSAYALGKTWYAPEMPRPGCVWTHTLVVPGSALAQIPFMCDICRLFRRPSETLVSNYYSKPITLDHPSLTASDERSDPNQLAEMQAFLTAHYQRKWHALILPAKNSDEFADLILGAWSQKWPGLRMGFTFCTGSLSSRVFERRLLDVQCVPVAAARQVLRESSEISSDEPLLINFAPQEVPAWAALAANDALQLEGGPVRRFLWSISDGQSIRADFESFLKVYQELSQGLSFSSAITLIADLFPGASDARQLKKVILGYSRDSAISQSDSKEVLLALATTEHFQSFDPDELQVKKQAALLLTEQPANAQTLMGQLFRAHLNPIGEAILTGLIEAMEPDDAVAFVDGQPQFIPPLVRINPALARLPQMWVAAGDQKRELLESLVSQEMARDLISQIVPTLLESGSDGFLPRAFERWGKDAVFAALDWVENHQGSMTETCRQALTLQIPDVMNWVQSGSRSMASLVAVAHVVAPYCSRISQQDSTVWLRTFRMLQESGQHEEATYLQTILLALGLQNAPPAPLDLIAESFGAIHAKAEWQRLRDNAWLILEPLVPKLSWRKNWDKCERLRRALIWAFVRHRWPALELKQRITNLGLLQELVRSAKKVEGGEEYFEDIARLL
jgi:hypothetical protein